MSHGLFRRVSIAPRLPLTLLWCGICLASVSAPWLALHNHSVSAAILYLFFSPVCHQDPFRSFTFLGQPLAVCHRCSGIYFGLLAVSWLPVEISAVVRFPERRRLWVVFASLPLLSDALLPIAGLWINSAASRFVTGLIFGAMLSTLLTPAMAELSCYLHGNAAGAE